MQAASRFNKQYLLVYLLKKSYNKTLEPNVVYN